MQSEEEMAERSSRIDTFEVKPGGQRGNGEAVAVAVAVARMMARNWRTRERSRTTRGSSGRIRGSSEGMRVSSGDESMQWEDMGK